MTAPSGPSPQGRDRGYDQHSAPVEERQHQTGMGAAAGSMWAGAVRRSLLWGAIGAVIGLALGLIPWVDVPLALRLVAFGVGGLLAGSAAGFVYGGGRTRDIDAEARRETSFHAVHPDQGDDR